MDFNRRPKDQEALDSLAEDIAQVARRLKEEYNVELIYLIIPNKYSIYNDLVEPVYVYDGFIPRINELLNRRGVRTIDGYSAYMEYKRKDGTRWLYNPNESHFTSLGKDILVDVVVKELARLMNPDFAKQDPG